MYLNFYELAFFLVRVVGTFLNRVFFICLNKKPSRRRKFNVTLVSRSQSVSANSKMTVWPQINRKSKNRIFPINYTQLASQNRWNHFRSYFCYGGGVFEKSLSIWHESCHDDDSSQYATSSCSKTQKLWKLILNRSDGSLSLF